MIYSTDQPSWVALEVMLGYLLPMKDALVRPLIAGSRCYVHLSCSLKLSLNALKVELVVPCTSYLSLTVGIPIKKGTVLVQK
jgi:hypothetical protein